ncbi:MAG: FkbM family methyltransferase [Thalassobaculum sp.]|uniref:FkbM family methyltransferase n=1 Tax=Thalassobaculum sp. TaxID=2022740 RepID=UPI0032F053A1
MSTPPNHSQILSAVASQPAHPMALAALLQFAASRTDIARSLTVLRWLEVLGLPAESIGRQRSMLSRIDKTFRHRDTVVERTGPFETRDIPGVGPLKFSTATGAARAFLALLDREGAGYEPGVLRYLVEAGRRGCLVADVGAHVGYYTTILGAAGARVIAFEMHPDLLLEVKRNLWANRLDRSHVINAAVGNYDGLIFNVRFDPTPGLRVEDTIATPPPNAIDKALYDPVLSVRLDTVFAREGVIPDLIKIDIEGYEFEALKGARNLIAGGRTRFLLEFHPHLVGAFGHRPEEILAVFPGDWSREVLEDDGTRRPIDPSGSDFAYAPDVENIKLLFCPPGR